MRKASRILVLAAIAILNIAMFVAPSSSNSTTTNINASGTIIDSTQTPELHHRSPEYLVDIFAIQKQH